MSVPVNNSLYLALSHFPLPAGRERHLAGQRQHDLFRDRQRPDGAPVPGAVAAVDHCGRGDRGHVGPGGGLDYDHHVVRLSAERLLRHDYLDADEPDGKRGQRIGRPEVSRLAASKWRAGGSVVKGVKTQFTIFYIFHPFVAIRSVLCYNCIIWYMNIIFRKKCPGLLIWTCGNIRSVGTDPNSRGFWEREKR